MSFVELSEQDLAAAASWPFPPEEGAIYDGVALAHWLGFTTVVPLEDAAGSKASPADPRLVAVAVATSVEINQAIAVSRAAGQATANAGAVRAEAGAGLDAFVDGLVAEPPVVRTPLPGSGAVIVFGGPIVIHVPPAIMPPVPPEWGEDERLRKIDLAAVAGRLLAAARTPEIGDLAADLSAAAARLMTAAQSR